MGQPKEPSETTSATSQPPSAPDAHALPEPTHEVSPAVTIEAAAIRIRLKSTGFTDEDITDIANLLLKKEKPKY